MLARTCAFKNLSHLVGFRKGSGSSGLAIAIKSGCEDPQSVHFTRFLKDITDPSGWKDAGGTCQGSEPQPGHVLHPSHLKSAENSLVYRLVSDYFPAFFLLMTSLRRMQIATTLDIWLHITQVVPCSGGFPVY